MTDLSSPSAHSPGTTDVQANRHSLTRYYQFHAKIYDATRWSFLFGRAALIHSAGARCRATRILEVGCGTGHNLRALAQAYPEAEITGIDLSPDMLTIAEKSLGAYRDRIRLRQEAYGPHRAAQPRYDLILFSYALTMFNPGWDAAIDCAHRDLFLDGTIAVVDFHRTAVAPFERWMATNHVRMTGHLLPKLRTHFSPIACEVAPAYAGLWHYFLFLGKK
ncbi:MAG: class I SAM-dependent methyltransferase [Caldilineaceae bacterium]|nr:class I SAM-dependent methyltransferase [Caldilineaceae bacterium]